MRIGSLASNLKEAQTLMMPIQLLLIVPLVVMVPIGRDPNGLLAQVLSWLPPFTPFVMMNRAAFPPGLHHYVGTTLLMLVSIFFALRLAARIFETGVLMTGKPPRLRHCSSCCGANAMSQADNRTVALADRFEFVERMKRSQRLPPRGQFRVIAADVRGPISKKTPNKFPHTLFFSSLLAAPLYHELIAAHYTLPANGKHGPFNVAEMTPADYRYRSTPLRFNNVSHNISTIDATAVRSDCCLNAVSNVTDFIDVLATQAFDIFALSPCDWFSDPAQQPLPARVVALAARVPRVRVIRYSAPQIPLPDVAFD